jgi:hypothetical protein
MRRCVYFCETYEVHVFHDDLTVLPEFSTLAELENLGLQFEVRQYSNDEQDQ